jgi:hypothetical protein
MNNLGSASGSVSAVSAATAAMLGEHDGPRKAGLDLLSAAPSFLQHATVIKYFPLPELGHTRFYFITCEGVFTVDSMEDDLGNNRSPLSPFFYKAQEVITQSRLVDIQMRRNAELAMIDLAGGSSSEGRIKMDVSAAVPALIRATEDQDADVRAGATHALAAVGPKAKDAVPALIRLLKDPQEGPRNTSCMALGAIGPFAKQALPALREAQNDLRKDVRQFARQAIKKLKGEKLTKRWSRHRPCGRRG